MDKILEALKKLLPEDQVGDVAQAVKESLDNSRTELEKEFEDKLEEAYADVYNKKKNAEEVAEQGYEEAYGIINDLRGRLEVQREEFEQALEEGYEEAYQMLQEERGKNDGLEVGMYEEYDAKLGDMKEYMVDKLDQFLNHKGREIYEQAKRDVLNDPRMAEHRVTLDKIVDTVSNYLSDDDISTVSSSKIEEAHSVITELKGQMRIIESKNIRLSSDNKKLNESVSEARSIISEHAKSDEEDVLTEQKERTRKAKSAEGKGERITDADTFVVKEDVSSYFPDEERDSTLTESTGVDLESLAILSGIKESH